LTTWLKWIGKENSARVSLIGDFPRQAHDLTSRVQNNGALCRPFSAFSAFGTIFYTEYKGASA
jgi:hypothetical protein